MTKFQMPPERTYNSGLKKHGLDSVVMIEAFPVRDGERLALTFESVRSDLRQGVFMMIDGDIVIHGKPYGSADLWQDVEPQSMVMECRTKRGALMLYNIWEEKGKRDSQSWASGMLTEELVRGWRYRCHDFGPELVFDKLVFRLERME